MMSFVLVDDDHLRLHNSGLFLSYQFLILIPTAGNSMCLSSSSDFASKIQFPSNPTSGTELSFSDVIWSD